jgi:hypothetical protein
MATIMFHTIRNKQIAHLQYKIISNDLIESFLCNLDMRRFIFRYTQWIPVSIINNRITSAITFVESQRDFIPD